MKPAPTLREVPEENENISETQQQQHEYQMEHLELNTTLGSTLGEFKTFNFSFIYIRRKCAYVYEIRGNYRQSTIFFLCENFHVDQFEF